MNKPLKHTLLITIKNFIKNFTRINPNKSRITSINRETKIEKPSEKPSMTNNETKIETHFTTSIKKFNHGFRWSLFGSLTYEILKTAHCFLLLKLLDAQVYGVVGSLFSIIYLSTYIADFGATNSCTPYLAVWTENKKNFKKLLWRYFLAPHIIILTTCSGIVTYFAVQKFATITNPPYLFLIPGIIILEAIRSFLRMFLYTVFKNKIIVITEVTIFICYISAIWIAHFFFAIPLTYNLIFVPHFIDSLFSVVLLSLAVYKYYKTLPDTEENIKPSLWKRIATTRIFNYLLRLSRHMFTSNVFTPLFAIKFGLKAAGIFYFASTVANVLNAVIKLTFGYTGGALLATLKDSPQQEKVTAFNYLCQRLMMVVAPIVIFLTINHKALIALSSAPNIASTVIGLSLLYLIITFTEFFFLLYEQFYIIEEATGKLFLFKLFEFAVFYGVIATATSSIVTTLLSVIIIRLVSFSIIAINAFYLWKITPTFKTNIRYFIASVIFALLATLVL